MDVLDPSTAAMASSLHEADAVAALAALAHPQRLRAFRALVQAGQQGLSAGALGARLGLAPSALSFHLKGLSQAGLIHGEARGRQLIYRGDFGRMNALLGYLTQHCCAGTDCGLDLPQVACADAPPTPPLSPRSTTESPVTTSHAHAHHAPHAPLNVLFLCTHNSARSILAEAMLNHLGANRFRAFSAGSSPRENQQPNPLAIRALQAAGVSTEGLHSKSWDVFAGPDAPHMDLIITVCDNAAGEVCPVWPGRPATAHWGYPDPSSVEGTEEERLRAFSRTLAAIRHRLELLISLPPAKLAERKLGESAQALATTPTQMA
ncbi:MAG: metalloregulator ArsR/SmtB family transcription factor [Pseudomonadota bacterium]